MPKPELPAPKTRGRPREFDADQALDAAILCFLQSGYSGVTIDDLCAAMGINKPSFYASFGSKKQLYVNTLELFRDRTMANIEATLLALPEVRQAFLGFYEGMVDLYFSGSRGQGCLVFCTTPIEALADDDIRAFLKTAIGALEALMEKRIAQAAAEKQISGGVEPKSLALLTFAVLMMINMRARAGESRKKLKELARSSVGAIFPPR